MRISPSQLICVHLLSLNEMDLVGLASLEVVGFVGAEADAFGLVDFRGDS